MIRSNSLTLASIWGRARISGQVVICPRPDGTPLVLGVDQAIPIGLILNELISNAFKHAFPDGRSGTLCIEAQRRVTAAWNWR